MKRGRAVRFAVILIAVASTDSGCSALFMRPVHRDGVLKTSDNCTSSRAAPVIDTLGWLVEGFRTGYALVAPDSAYQGQTLSRGGDIAIGVTLMALYAASSGYGFSAATECEKVKDDEEYAPPPPRRRRLRPRDLTPPPMPPPIGATPAYEATAYAAPPIDGGTDAPPPSDGGAAPDVGAVRSAPPAAVVRPAPPAVPQQRDPE